MFPRVLYEVPYGHWHAQDSPFTTLNMTKPLDKLYDLVLAPLPPGGFPGVHAHQVLVSSILTTSSYIVVGPPPPQTHTLFMNHRNE